MASKHRKRAGRAPLRVRIHCDMRVGNETLAGSLSLSPGMAMAVYTGRAKVLWSQWQGPAGRSELLGTVIDAEFPADVARFAADVRALEPRALGTIGQLRKQSAMNPGGQRDKYAEIVKAAASEWTKLKGRAPTRRAARAKAIRMAEARIALPEGNPARLEPPVLAPEQRARFERETAGADPSQRMRHLLETFITRAMVEGALPSKKAKK